MSFRGGRGGDRGGGRGGGDRGGRGGDRGGGRFGGRGFGGGRGRGGFADDGPPAEVCEVGAFLHDAEGELVCRLTHVMIPYFNAGIYLENKSKIGKVEEVFGPVNKVYFTIKPDSGISAGSFQANDKVYIGTDKLLPLSRFTNESKSGGGGRGGGRGGSARGGGRGPPRGGGRGGRGPPRGGAGFRGGGFSRGGRGGGRGR